MDKCREAFETWFRTTKEYQMLEDQNYFKMDIFHFVDGRNEYRHTSVQIAFMTWQSRQAEVESLQEEYAETELYLRGQLTDRDSKIANLEYLLEQDKSLIPILNKKLEEKDKRIEVLENRIEEGLGFIDKFHCEGWLSDLDNAEKALRGEHE
ncbi:hypothetical protein [Acinetobacter bereziniae]|uniref:hypothetical protein n=1 Tax=Acinetobacter bereziniae TaxID=106648 RepID=UPI00124F77C0|nr:hypothetical protein [Acinetobacter bereziniae]